MSILVRCECGKELRAGDEYAGRQGVCFACGRLLTIPAQSIPEMASVHAQSESEAAPPVASSRYISFRCPCGTDLRVRSEMAGQDDLCPGCGLTVVVPLSQAEAIRVPFAARAAIQRPLPLPPAPAASPRASAVVTIPADLGAAPQAIPTLPYHRAAPARPRLLTRGMPIRDRLYFVLLLALIPLVISTFTKDDLKERIERTKEHNPMVEAHWNDYYSDDDLFNALPDHRIEGASFARETQVHWLFGAISATVFFTLALTILRSRDTQPFMMLGVALFTGTIGVFILLATGIVQEFFMRVYVFNRFTSSSLFLQFVAFTVGVGFFEEACKALPLIWYFRRKGALGWRGACVWGLVSGAAFGVNEAIQYSIVFYNGVCTAGDYWVRFASCITLHAVWTAAVGIRIFRDGTAFKGDKTKWELLAWTAYLLGVPILLHGAYDALLTQGRTIMALIVALASFGWLAYQIEDAKTREIAAYEAAAALR